MQILPITQLILPKQSCNESCGMFSYSSSYSQVLNPLEKYLSANAICKVLDVDTRTITLSWSSCMRMENVYRRK